MKAKFTSRCFVCKEQIAKGAEVYYERGKGTAHWPCLGDDNKPPSDSQIELADRLGFRDYSVELAALNNEKGGQPQEGINPPAAAKDLTA